MKKLAILFSLLATVIFTCSLSTQSLGQNKAVASAVSIIPKPQHLSLQPGQFLLNTYTRIYVNPAQNELLPVAQQLAQVIKTSKWTQPQILQQQPPANATNFIYLTLQQTPDTLGTEGYSLKVKSEQIILSANQPQGIFYGIQSIKQLLPTNYTAVPVPIPAVAITDKPQYTWRGMHLDVARHFFPVEFIKQYLDYMVMHKLNTFHWHLTDDQGWRIEIKKYPKLTQIGAWRDGTLIGHALERPQQFDGQRYGGFYTQDEIREVVQYAQERFITVVPEIEMPGHAVAALAAYPELSCTGGPIQVEQAWGIFKDIFCAGNEQTFQFLEDVLTEVTALFPSKIIHIGGDEAPKDRWKNCAKCQARMAANNLKNEHELQSYFIQRIEKFLNSKGRKIIGWDEILEGGLAPNALVMSWRGTAGGVAAAKQQHHVVMTPSSHVYFDYYQGDPQLEPLAFGGYTPLEKVYKFNPTPAQLTKEESKYILGAQANLWTEYIPTTEQAEYMLLPRLSALSEALWTAPANKDWEDFKTRMQQQYQRYEAIGANYATSAFQVEQQVAINSAAQSATITLENDAAATQLFYTLIGSVPTPSSILYTKPFTLTASATIKAASFQDGRMIDEPTTKKVTIHKAFVKPVKLTNSAHRYYAGQGSQTLVNGLTGSTNQGDGQWLGFLAENLEAVIDLKQPTTITSISSSYLQNMLANIFLPVSIEFAVSENGKDYKTVKVIENDIDPLKGGFFTHTFSASTPTTEARYVKVTAQNIKRCPPGHRSAGNRSWLFADEIVVE